MKTVFFYLGIIIILCTNVQGQPKSQSKSWGKKPSFLLVGYAYELPYVDIDGIPYPNVYFVALPVLLHPQAQVLGTFNVNINTRLLPEDSRFFTEAWYTEWGFEGRYLFAGGMYALAGAHKTTIRTGDIYKQTNPPSDFYDAKYPAITANIPSLSFGIGFAGPEGFAEFRYHSGLENFELIDGLHGSLDTYSFRFGVNFDIKTR